MKTTMCVLVHEKETFGQVIYVKEDVGVISERTQQQPLPLAINETNMTTAFMDYLAAILNRSSKAHSQKSLVIEKLKETSRGLK